MGVVSAIVATTADTTLWLAGRIIYDYGDFLMRRSDWLADQRWHKDYADALPGLVD